MRIFVDKQGNWQPYADWQDAVVELQPDQFAFHDVDVLPTERSVYIDGEFVAVEMVDDGETVDIPPIDPVAVWDAIAEQEEMIMEQQMLIEELQGKLEV